MPARRRQSTAQAFRDNSGELDRAWEERPDLLRQFLESRDNFQALCDEVAYILEKHLKTNAVEYAAVVRRAKSLHSFAEKVVRKGYENPLQQMTDLAGVRIVFLYNQDRSTIEKMIAKNFSVVERVDNLEGRDADQFGYGALHYLVKLGQKASGARYDDLKGLICEIQVRTVLQDAWAIIDHHLSYKHENDVPKVLIRKLNSLAGLFETADDQFDQIKTERDDYVEQITSDIQREKNTDQALDLDVYKAYLKARFPSLRPGNEEFVSSSFEKLKPRGYQTIGDLDALLQRTAKARQAVAKARPPAYAQAEINRAIALERPEYRGKGWNEELVELFEKYQGLIEKRDTAGAH